MTRDVVRVDNVTEKVGARRREAGTNAETGVG